MALYQAAGLQAATIACVAGPVVAAAIAFYATSYVLPSGHRLSILRCRWSNLERRSRFDARACITMPMPIEDILWRRRSSDDSTTDAESNSPSPAAGQTCSRTHSNPVGRGQNRRSGRAGRYGPGSSHPGVARRERRAGSHGNRPLFLPSASARAKYRSQRPSTLEAPYGSLRQTIRHPATVLEGRL